MRSLRPVLFLLPLLSFSSNASAAVASLICNSTAVQAVVRTEGLTERLGEMVFTCNGNIPGGDVGASFSVFMNAPVTNRIDGNGFTDATLTVDSGIGTIPATVRGRLVGSNALVFEHLNWTLTSFAVSTIKIANIRVNATGPSNRAILASVATNGLSRIVTNQPNLTIGYTQPGLLANLSTASILCDGSPLPEGGLATLSNLYSAGTRVSSIRVTEGTTNGFEPRQLNTTSGTRVVVKYSGFPTASQVFVPDVVAGSSATEQSAAGDLGVPRALGKYTPGGSGQLLLIRVHGHDANGAGGALVWAPPFGATGPLTFDGASGVSLTNGAGIAVYEVYDSAPSILESAQIPTFLALPLPTGGQPTLAQASVSYGPLSDVKVASETAPIPRFAAVAPGVDCTIVKDCGADYFPHLFVDAPPLIFQAQAGVPGFLGKFIRILNDNGGLMIWTATIQYGRDGPTGWLRVSREIGTNNASIILDAFPEKLTAPGVYTATLIIDAGPLAGTRMLPVSITATEAPKPIVRPAISKVYNAADPRFATLVPGSRAVLEGARLKGDQMQIVIDNVDAPIVSSTDTRVEFVVPASLGFRSAALLVYTAGFVPSEAFSVALTAAAPAIYPNGVLNQNGVPNSLENPEFVGNIFQVFASGLPDASLGTISAKIHDREISQPLFAGPAPGLDGIQQVNFAIPDDLPAMNSEVIVCGWPANSPGQRVCSPPAVITLRRPEPQAP
ncbi:MAG: hypothetical protein ABI972_29740 [Acidobacteriota bacterium]